MTMWAIGFLVLWLLIHSSLYGQQKNGTGGEFAVSAFLACLPLGLLMALLDYFGTDEGKRVMIWMFLAGVVALVGFRFLAKRSAKKHAEEAQRRAELIQKVERITKHEYFRGFQEKSNLGWVRTSGEENREAVEETLKVLAATLGANALIKYYWQSEKETYQAGKGPKGNPYYRNRTVFGGEAVAVVLEKANARKSKIEKEPYQTKPDFKKYAGKSIVLDGNNIVGGSGWEFDPLTKLLAELRQSKYKYTVFFDNNIFRALKERDLISQGQSITECISVIMGEQPENIVVAPKGEEADPYIIEQATRHNAAIISNDAFNDFRIEYPWLESGERLLSFRISGTDVLVPKLRLSAVS